MAFRYLTTRLEDWVTMFYKHIGVTTPNELRIEVIAKRCGIKLSYTEMDCCFLMNDIIQIIILDSRLSESQQREAFFHELCHVIRHGGLQGDLPIMFRELQERDAEHFTRYAAIPYHMLDYIRLDSGRDIVADMSELFKVTPSLCRKRLEQISNRLLTKEYIV